jgi:hypothetical protein
LSWHKCQSYNSRCYSDRLSVSRDAKRHFSETTRFYTGKSIKHEFNEEGIVITEERGHAFFRWNEITGYEDYGSAWRLALSGRDNMLVPTENLSEEMKRFIRSHLWL